MPREAWRSKKMCWMSFWLGPRATMFSGKQVIRRVEKGVGRMLNAEVIYHLTQGAAEPGVFSDTAESQSSSRSLIVAFS